MSSWSWTERGYRVTDGSAFLVTTEFESGLIYLSRDAHQREIATVTLEEGVRVALDLLDRQDNDHENAWNPNYRVEETPTASRLIYTVGCSLCGESWDEHEYEAGVPVHEDEQDEPGRSPWPQDGGYSGQVGA